MNMAEIRVRYLDAKNATPTPCVDPFAENTYREAETGDLVLPEGWTPAVVNYYLKEHPQRAEALRWLAGARITGTFNKLCPSLKMAQVRAWIENPPT